MKGRMGVTKLKVSKKKGGRSPGERQGGQAFLARDARCFKHPPPSGKKTLSGKRRTLKNKRAWGNHQHNAVGIDTKA